MAGKLDFSHTAGKIESVVITWRRHDGVVRSMSVDTKKARGIIWRFDPDPEMIKSFANFQGRTAPPFPRVEGTAVKILGQESPPVIQHPQSDGDVFCYWDETEGEWICPPEPEP